MAPSISFEFDCDDHTEFKVCMTMMKDNVSFLEIVRSNIQSHIVSYSETSRIIWKNIEPMKTDINSLLQCMDDSSGAIINHM